MKKALDKYQRINQANTKKEMEEYIKQREIDWFKARRHERA